MSLACSGLMAQGSPGISPMERAYGAIQSSNEGCAVAHLECHDRCQLWSSYLAKRKVGALGGTTRP